MAKLIDVYRNDAPLASRQFPLTIDENLTMVMDLNSLGLVCDHANVVGKELEDIKQKLSLLSEADLVTALSVRFVIVQKVLYQTVPCIGCRRSVERLFFQIMTSEFSPLDPLMITSKGVLTIRSDIMHDPNQLCNLFHEHSTRLNNLVDSQPRSKKSQRCLQHSLDSQRTRPVTPVWRDVWECMQPQCKDEVVLIKASSLYVTLENYLRKHRFCVDCRTKVLRAYILLVEVPDPTNDKGYVASLYSGIKRCLPDKHLHLPTKTDYIANLIFRAEPEIMGSRRERHAKTLEIAQEEVLTCLGICVYERLHRIYKRLREEECTCQVLAALAVDCLVQSFETAVEIKRGISQMDLFYDELTRDEQEKSQRKEQKKLKRRRKKERRAELDEKENCLYQRKEPCSQKLQDSSECLDIDLCVHGKETCFSPVDVNLQEELSSIPCTSCDKSKLDKIGKKSKEKITNGNCLQVDKEKDVEKTHHHSCGVDNEKCNNNTVKTETCTCRSCPCEKDVGVECELLNEKICKKRRGRLHEGWSSSEHSQDCGYSSENNNGCCDTVSTSSSLPSSPEGSDVACSEGFCNHDGECNDTTHHDYDHHHQHHQHHHHHHSHNPHPPDQTQTIPTNDKLTLEQMLDLCSTSDEDGEESYIPAEEVQEFKSKVDHLTEKRQELRENLKIKFAQMCFNVPLSQPRLHAPAKFVTD